MAHTKPAPLPRTTKQLFWAAIGVLGLFTLVLVFRSGIAGGFRFPEAPGTLRQQDLGAAWPFTVAEGRVECRRGNQVVFLAEGKVYAVNEIRADDQAMFGEKISMAPVLDAGLRLCS
jgi:hypothetical protein